MAALSVLHQVHDSHAYSFYKGFVLFHITKGLAFCPKVLVQLYSMFLVLALVHGAFANVVVFVSHVLCNVYQGLNMSLGQWRSISLTIELHNTFVTLIVN